MLHYLNRLAYSYGTAFIIFISASNQITTDVCYDVLRIRSEPETCTQSTDCYDTNAECIYSLEEARHVCCKPRPNAIFPECPNGRQMLRVGKYMPVLCTFTNSIEDDTCPQGYECLPSVTSFSGDNESNNICCAQNYVLLQH